jgi:hypothetical protein
MLTRTFQTPEIRLGFELLTVRSMAGATLFTGTAPFASCSDIDLDRIPLYCRHHHRHRHRRRGRGDDDEGSKQIPGLTLIRPWLTKARANEMVLPTSVMVLFGRLCRPKRRYGRSEATQPVCNFTIHASPVRARSGPLFRRSGEQAPQRRGGPPEYGANGHHRRALLPGNRELWDRLCGLLDCRSPHGSHYRGSTQFE